MRPKFAVDAHALVYPIGIGKRRCAIKQADIMRVVEPGVEVEVNLQGLDGNSKGAVSADLIIAVHVFRPRELASVTQQYAGQNQGVGRGDVAGVDYAVL